MAANKNGVGVYGSVQTEREASREEVQETSVQKRTELLEILDWMDSCVYVVDGDCNLQYVNAAVRREFGPPEGRKCYEYLNGRIGVCPGCPKDDVGATDTQRRIWHSQKTRKTYEVTDTPLSRRDGTLGRLNICRPIDPGTAEDALVESRSRSGLRLRAELPPRFCGIVASDPKMLEIFETIDEVAASEVPVLIQGESGTGKELVATAIHERGPRARGAFVPVNCSALPESLLESELFGHVRGAFSGAIRDKKGRFELADGGTLFLDEVGDLSPAVQVSLLRVLQEGTLERVGGEETIHVDVRVISATNKNLASLVALGKFREDLYYRLCVIPIGLPPLRERRGDIPLLANYILKQIGLDTGKESVSLSSAALDAMIAYEWPGNVRELQNVLHYASVKCKGTALNPGHFPPVVSVSATPSAYAPKRGRKRKITIEAVQRALVETGGNKMEAAQRLGVCRATLYKYLTP